MSTDTVDQPPIEATSLPWKACTPPQDETIDWFENSVRPALKHLADTDLLSFDLLHKATADLPDSERLAWYKLVRSLEVASDKAAFGATNRFWVVLRWFFFTPKDPLRHNLFRKLLVDLNTNWFIPRRLLLYPYVEPQVPLILRPRLWETAGVALARINKMLVIPFAGGAIPVYLVEHLLPWPTPAARNPCYYDPIARLVMMDESYLLHEAFVIKAGASTDVFPPQFLVATGHWHRDSPWIEGVYCRILSAGNRPAQNIYAALVSRVLFEELRHGMDALRIGRYTSDNEPDRRWSETMFAPSSRLWQLLWEPAQAKGAETLLGGLPVDITGVFSELSAQLTASLVPYFVLLGWWRNFAIFASSASSSWIHRFQLHLQPEHTSAGILGTILLGEQLNCGPPLTASVLREPDFAELAELCLRIAKRPVPQLRLALQAVYQNEFNYPIDESPFPEILPSGELRFRSWDEVSNADNGPKALRGDEK